MSDAHKGITKSESDRKAISERQKGNQVWLGRKHTAESRQKMSECARKGADSNFWKGGVTPVIRSLRSFKEYRVWRTAVFERDNYTCQACGIRGGKLEADHIKRFSEHPELRFDIRNGRTLCVPCHKTTDNYGRRGMASRQAA
jgi:general stress protein YciG